MKPTVGSLFSGIGGLDLAAHWAGFETAWFVEKEPFCQKVLAKHWPIVPIYDDVFTCKDLPHVDVICGGFPCQPFSEAGQQKGEEDERFLLPEMLRIVSEVKPYAVLFENVRGFPKLDHGNSFKYLLRKLAEMGFDAEWGHIFAKDAGAPHPRERWFCVAYMVNFTQRNEHHITKSASRELQQTILNATDSRDDCQSIHKQELEHAESIGFRSQLRGGGSAAEVAALDNTNPFRNQPNIQGFKSRLVGTLDGLPSRLDFIGFPARPGQPQYAYEPPRTAPFTPTTNDRIKALGNAVVPQVAYPIFEAIAEWLQENDA